MQKVVTATILLLLASIVPARAQVHCDQATTQTASAAGTQTVLPAMPSGGPPTQKGSGRYYICGYKISVTTASSTAQLTYAPPTANSNGQSCGTQAGIISPSFGQGVGANASSEWRGLIVPSGDLLCFTVSGTSPAASVTVHYTIR